MLNSSFEWSNVKEEILAIADQCIGSNYLTEEELLEYVEASNILVITSDLAHTITGFSIVCQLNTSSVLDRLFLSQHTIEERFDLDKKVGFRKITAVHPDHQGKGIAGRLFEQGEHFLQQECSSAFSICWTPYPGKGRPIEQLLKKNGYQSWVEIPQYWKEDSLKKKYDCPVCGQPPCLCAATIFDKKFNR